jgi:surface carbohydrate biosynthesis protein
MTTPIPIIFAIEGIARELDYRLVLAAKMADRHHRVIIGHANLMRLVTQLEGGIYLGKHLAGTQLKRRFRPFDRMGGRPSHHIAKEHGHVVLYLHEEGAVFMGQEDAWRQVLDTQFDCHLHDEEDQVLNWGRFQADHYRAKKPACVDNIFVTGHPRFDLLTPKYRELFEDEAEEIKKEFGNFVLFNTNFSMALHAQGTGFEFKESEWYNPRDPVGRERFVHQWARTYGRVTAFVELAHALSIRRPDVNIVLRPHPTEDDTLYRAAFQGVPNIHVVRRGTVIPWLIASSMVVHDGCTTGIETYLLDHPLLNYRPCRDDDSDIYLPNLLGLAAEKHQDALDILLAHLEDPTRYRPTPTRDSIPQRARDLFANFEHEAFEPVVERMREAERRIRRPPKLVPRSRHFADEAVTVAIEQAKRPFRPLSTYRYLFAKHMRTVFPGFDKRHIGKRLERIERIEKKRLSMTYYSPYLFEINAA